MTRREVAEMILNYIKSIGFKPYNIKYGNRYFIFDKGEDGVIHFDINGLHGWKFAMWINTNENELKSEDGKETYPALQFFTQHKDNIDKFKPSRSAFMVEYTLRECTTPAPYQWWQIKDIFKMIKRHPFIAYYNDKYGSYEIGSSYILSYFKTKFIGYKNKLVKIYKDWVPITWVKFKLLFCGNNKIIERIRIIDGNSHGFISYPRWDLDILFNKSSTDGLECGYLNRWFSRRNSNISLRIHRIGIDGYYDYAEE